MNINFDKYDLNKVYTVEAVSTGKDECDLAIDIGSTETRTLRFDAKTLNFKDVLAVSSAYAILDEDIKHIPSKSKSIYDNLELYIEDVTADKVEDDKIIKERLHIIKEGLLLDTQKTGIRTNSNQGKIEQEPTYVNVLANIAIESFIANSIGQNNFRTTCPKLTISLPPKDTQNVNRLNKFKKLLSGVYEVTLVRFAYKVKIVIDKQNIVIEDESNAVLRFWNSLYKTTDEEETTIVIDGGGSTVDLGVLKNGRLISSASHSLPFGGNRLIEYVREDYVNKTGSIAPKDSMMKTAIEKGYIPMGKQKVSMKAHVHSAKIRIAREVLAELDKLFDKSDLTPTEVANVVCAGGMFRTVKGSAEFMTPSLATYVEKLFKSKSEYTEFSRIDCEYPIPYGLAFYKASKSNR